MLAKSVYTWCLVYLQRTCSETWNFCVFPKFVTVLWNEALAWRFPLSSSMPKNIYFSTCDSWPAYFNTRKDDTEWLKSKLIKPLMKEFTTVKKLSSPCLAGPEIPTKKQNSQDIRLPGNRSVIYLKILQMQYEWDFTDFNYQHILYARKQTVDTSNCK